MWIFSYICMARVFRTQTSGVWVKRPTWEVTRWFSDWVGGDRHLEGFTSHEVKRLTFQRGGEVKPEPYIYIPNESFSSYRRGDGHLYNSSCIHGQINNWGAHLCGVKAPFWYSQMPPTGSLHIVLMGTWNVGNGCPYPSKK